jgi:hypothetical protein
MVALCFFVLLTSLSLKLAVLLFIKMLRYYAKIIKRKTDFSAQSIFAIFQNMTDIKKQNKNTNHFLKYW